MRKVRTKKSRTKTKHREVACCIRAERRPGDYMHSVRSGILRTDYKTVGRQHSTAFSVGGSTHDVWPPIPPGKLIMLPLEQCPRCGNTDRCLLQTELHGFERQYAGASSARPNRIKETAILRCLECYYEWNEEREVFGKEAIAIDKKLQSFATVRV